MKLKIEANNFCPDDCPYADITCEDLYWVDGRYRQRICENKEMCAYVHSLRDKNEL